MGMEQVRVRVCVGSVIVLFSVEALTPATGTLQVVEMAFALLVSNLALGELPV